MLTWLPKPLVGVLALTLYTLNISWWASWLLVAALIRWLLPIKKWQRFWQHVMHQMPSLWILCNNIIMRLTTRTQWDIQGLENLNPKAWYMLIANHQTWTDILVIFKTLGTRVSPIRYFLKEELRWLPIVGQACWILDFPFMRRHNTEAVARHPELRLQDIETTRKACEKFKHIPITLVSFLEGTRFQESKQQKQKSPFKHLLKPKAGGIAFALATMGEQIKEIIDVTIVYQHSRTNFWDFCCGKVKKITIHIRVLPITANWLGNYIDDKRFRRQFQEQINDLWQEKDELMDKLLQ